MCKRAEEIQTYIHVHIIIFIKINVEEQATASTNGYLEKSKLMGRVIELRKVEAVIFCVFTPTCFRLLNHENVLTFKNNNKVKSKRNKKANSKIENR